MTSFKDFAVYSLKKLYSSSVYIPQIVVNATGKPFQLTNKLSSYKTNANFLYGYMDFYLIGGPIINDTLAFEPNLEFGGNQETISRKTIENGLDFALKNKYFDYILNDTTFPLYFFEYKAGDLEPIIPELIDDVPFRTDFQINCSLISMSNYTVFRFFFYHIVFASMCPTRRRQRDFSP